MTPISARPSATPGGAEAARRRLRLRSSTIGRTTPASSASSSGPTSQRSGARPRRRGTMIASGLPQRRLRSRSARDRLRVGRVAGEVEAAEALDREDARRRAAARAARATIASERAASTSRSRWGRGEVSRSGDQCPVVERGASSALQVEPRAADEAGVGLGVEAAVARVAVLLGALGAHREVAHRGHRPVVGDVADDGEARAAVRAVDERVAVAAVAGSRSSASALGARGDVGRDERHRALLGARRADREVAEALGLDVLGDDASR